MRVELAKSAGFCYGVRRAVEMAQQAAESGERVVMLGPVIHNDHVVAALEEKGVACLSSVDQVPAGAAVILRSHGEARAVHEALAAKGCTVIDTACPNVSRIHRLVQEAEARGRQQKVRRVKSSRRIMTGPERMENMPKKPRLASISPKRASRVRTIPPAPLKGFKTESLARWMLSSFWGSNVSS